MKPNQNSSNGKLKRKARKDVTVLSKTESKNKTLTQHLAKDSHRLAKTSKGADEEW